VWSPPPPPPPPPQSPSLLPSHHHIIINNSYNYNTIVHVIIIAIVIVIVIISIIIVVFIITIITSTSSPGVPPEVDSKILHTRNTAQQSKAVTGIHRKGAFHDSEQIDHLYFRDIRPGVQSHGDVLAFDQVINTGIKTL